MSTKSEEDKMVQGIIHLPTLRLKLAAQGILVGIAAGLCIVVLRSCLEMVSESRSRMVAFLQGLPPYLVLVWVAGLVLTAFIIASLCRRVPSAAGGGIPRVRAIMLGLAKDDNWFTILITKLVTTIMGIGAGLSMGREGPSVQIGAMAAEGVSRAFKNTNAEERALISSGVGAGLAAAFNAPLGGFMFTMEVMQKNFSTLVIAPTLVASVTAGVIAHTFFGMDTVFLIKPMPLLHQGFLPHLILLGLFSGFMGVLFNKVFFGIGAFYKLPIFKNSVMKIAFPLLLTIPLTYLLPQVLGAGDGIIGAMINLKGSISMILLLLLGKYLFTVLSTGSGAPGGCLQPMLVLGSLTGGLFGSVASALGFMPPEYRLHMVVFGMAGFFAGSVRTPVTAILLLLELTGRFYHIVPLSIVSLCAYAAGELLRDKPMFDRAMEGIFAKLDGPKPLPANQDQHLMEVSVEEGSRAEGKSLSELRLPGKALVIFVRRGNQTFVPDGSVRFMAGDFVYLVPNQAKLTELASVFKSAAN
jgi:H+/Cl- antiporter ClcA